MPTTTQPKPSPMRMLRTWLARERAIRGPAAIELDVAERQVRREQDSVRSATGEAATIERRLQAARNKIRAALTDSKTPGVIDAAETRGIARELVGAGVVAHRHTQSLEVLS